MSYAMLQKNPFSGSNELEIPSRIWNALLNFDTVYERPVSNYPPFNLIQQGEDNYRIEIAVAGFTIDEIDITRTGQNLTISSKLDKKDDEDTTVKYLRRKLAKRTFKLEFTLGNHIQIDKANLDNGILTIDLTRHVPEEMKPKKIPILTINNNQLLENQIES